LAKKNDMSDPTITTTPSYPAELRALLERAGSGDATALPAVRQAFASHPELVTFLGDLASRARESLLDLIAGTDLASKEAVAQRAAALRDELIGEEESPLIRLLAERVGFCWIELHGADLNLARVLRSQPRDTQASLAASKRVSEAQRRFIAAVKGVALVKKLIPRGPSPLDILLRDVPERGSPRRQSGARTTRLAAAASN
jgi:hypothetical protein